MNKEEEIEQFLEKQKKIRFDEYQCQKCGSVIHIEKGITPTECSESQGGCGRKHKDFVLVETIVDEDEFVKQVAEETKKIEVPEGVEMEVKVTKEEEPVKKKTKDEKPTKDQIKKELIREAKQKEEEADMQLKSALIEDISSNVYLEMDTYVDMVKRGISYGCVLEGRGGTGKTWRVINHLKDTDYAYTDSYTTPQALYCWLYANRNKEVLVVDDVAGFMDNTKVLAFLKGGLWHVGENKNRLIHYMTTKPMQDEYGNYVPNAFVLNARMVVITNKMNKRNPHLNAILTRINYCQIQIDWLELMNILEQVAKKEYEGLSLEERMEVFKFIKDNTSEVNDDLNIRSLIKCFQQYLYSKKIKSPDLWKRLAMLNIIQKNPDLVVVQELLENPELITENMKMAEFNRMTGKSRATYFRLKDQLRQVGDKLKKEEKPIKVEVEKT